MLKNLKMMIIVLWSITSVAKKVDEVFFGLCVEQFCSFELAFQSHMKSTSSIYFHCTNSQFSWHTVKRCEGCSRTNGMCKKNSKWLSCSWNHSLPFLFCRSQSSFLLRVYSSDYEIQFSTHIFVLHYCVAHFENP